MKEERGAGMHEIGTTTFVLGGAPGLLAFGQRRGGLARTKLA